MSKRATYQDVLEAPEGLTAELIGGELFLSPRPAAPHEITSSTLGGELVSRFRQGRGGPGGWVVLHEPELWLGTDPAEDEVLVPDLAGWRRERFVEPARHGFEARPDWVCEVLSPSSVRRDRLLKLAVYAREEIAHAWIVDPVAETVEVFERTERGTYALVATASGLEEARLPPFDAVALSLADWWISALR